MSRLHIADTGLFVAMGQPSNSCYQSVRRFACRNDLAFVLPERVYGELTVDDPDIEIPPIDAAIDERVDRFTQVRKRCTSIEDAVADIREELDEIEADTDERIEALRDELST